MFVSMSECGGDTDGDYNDVQLLDTSSDTLNGASSVTENTMNSSTAINDNLLNTQRQQLHRFRLLYTLDSIKMYQCLYLGLILTFTFTFGRTA